MDKKTKDSGEALAETFPQGFVFFCFFVFFGFFGFFVFSF